MATSVAVTVLVSMRLSCVLLAEADALQAVGGRARHLRSQVFGWEQAVRAVAMDADLQVAVSAVEQLGSQATAMSWAIVVWELARPHQMYHRDLSQPMVMGLNAP
jgi:hypothetical protein